MILFLGFGRVAQRFIQTVKTTSIATSRNLSRSPEPFVQFIPFDKGSITNALHQATHVVSSIPPSDSGEDPIFEVLGNDFYPLLKQKDFVVYLSSTGVYADQKGEWADESAPCLLDHPRYKAENIWHPFLETNGSILRLSGLYDEKDNAISSLVSSNKDYTIKKEGHYFSRIHLSDVAQQLNACLVLRQPGIFNVSDNHPAPLHDVEQYAAHLLRRPVLKEIDFMEAVQAHLVSQRMLAYFEHNKRVSNAKMQETFKTDLMFKSYREGLTSSDIFKARC